MICLATSQNWYCGVFLYSFLPHSLFDSYFDILTTMNVYFSTTISFYVAYSVWHPHAVPHGTRWLWWFHYREDRDRPQHVIGIFTQQMLGVVCMLIANCFTILAGWVIKLVAASTAGFLTAHEGFQFSPHNISSISRMSFYCIHLYCEVVLDQSRYMGWVPLPLIWYQRF